MTAKGACLSGKPLFHRPVSDPTGGGIRASSALVFPAVKGIRREHRHFIVINDLLQYLIPVIKFIYFFQAQKHLLSPNPDSFLLKHVYLLYHNTTVIAIILIIK